MRPHHTHWPARVPHALRVPVTSLWDNLAISAHRFPDKTALSFLGRDTSYAELSRQVEVLAARLAELGVARGDRVLLDMQNCPQLVVAHFAILRANAVVVPVNPMNRAHELAHYITDPDARVAIVTSDLAADMAMASNSLPAAQGLRHLIVTHYTDAFDPEQAGELPASWASWLLARPELPQLVGGMVQSWAQAMACASPAPAHVVGCDDMALLPYTSGTTGLPKGCIHPHRTIMHNVMAGALWGGGSVENINLCVVPMFHITGIVVLLHTSMYLGATMVIMPRWDRELAGQLISRHRVTQWTNIPTMVIDLLGSPNFDRFDLSSLQYIGGGGAGMPQAVAQRLFDLYGLRYVEGYGLTETAAPSHSNPPDRPKQQCLGVPYLSSDARVINPDTLAEVPVGESGEIIIHGPMVFEGYWKRPEATRDAFIEFEGKRYFRSGDMGRVDEEGYFFMTDRLKRMINASGFKVWPAEVESLMFRHPAIQEACVIAARDAYRGETVKAVVVLRAGQRGQVSEQDIIDWCRDNMAVYKAPRIVQFADSLPKSGSGKVMWRALQEAEPT
jgi:fatty-acyl-CoA synthase